MASPCGASLSEHVILEEPRTRALGYGCLDCCDPASLHAATIVEALHDRSDGCIFIGRVWGIQSLWSVVKEPAHAQESLSMPTTPCDPADIVAAALAEGRPAADGLLALRVFAAQGGSWAAEHRQVAHRHIAAPIPNLRST